MRGIGDHDNASDRSETAAIRIVLADDHPIVLDALVQLFRLEPDIRVVGQCTRGAEVVPTVRRHRPDVLVLDLSMPQVDGLAVLRQLSEAALPTRTVILTASIQDKQLVDAVGLGARGILLKDMAPRLIVQCVRTVHGGGEWFDQTAATRALERLLKRDKRAGSAAGVLTKRELELVRHVAAGLRNRDIADRLHISDGTVKTHLHNIFEKVGVGSRVALILWAQENGLI